MKINYNEVEKSKILSKIKELKAISKNEKKANVETDVEIEYELLNEPEKLLYGWGYEIYSKQIPREGLWNNFRLGQLIH